MDGMYDSMMTEIAYELHRAMPKVMKKHHLKEMWAYKYESSKNDSEERTGIHVHADDGEYFLMHCKVPHHLVVSQFRSTINSDLFNDWAFT